MRFGLCCIFREAPIHFRTTTVTHFAKKKDLHQISALILSNIDALMQALSYCADHQIGAFRVVSSFFPLSDHPVYGYLIEDLPDYALIIQGLKCAKICAREKNVRITFHPDQFIVLNSPHPEVVASSIRNIEYHARLAEYLGGDVVTIHGGGGYGDKANALIRLGDHLALLSERAKKKITLENDDKIFTPEDLLPLCHAHHIPFVYDVHHHRCLPDSLSIEEATHEALRTWGKREPLFHISSPLNGWKGKYPHRHHDFIDPKDFPSCWLSLKKVTIDVEAKAKELAVLALQQTIIPQVFLHAKHD